MNKATRGAAALVGGLALSFAVQLPALAQTYTHVDARHDVERSPQDVHASQYRKADATKVRITHSEKAIRFDIRLRSVSLKDIKFRGAGFKVKTPDHRTFTGGWITHRGSVQYYLSDETGKDVNCAESSGTNGHTIWMKLDRSCFGNPRWIRASVGVGTNNGISAWSDNALSGNWRHASDDVFSPRIHAS